MKKLYVGNLTFDTTEAQLLTMFQNYGSVESAKLVMDGTTGHSRGFGFIEMPDSEEAAKAIAGLNGQDSGGRPLTVNEARPKSGKGGGGHTH